MFRFTAITLHRVGLVAYAVEETLTTPCPVLDRGRAASVASLLTFTIGVL